MAINRQGFSLIEVLLTLATVSAFIALGSSSLVGYLDKLHLNQATSELEASLKSMGEDALRFSQQVQLDESNLTEGKITWFSSDHTFGNIQLVNGATITEVQKSIAMQPIWFTGRGLPFQQVSFTIGVKNLRSTVVLLPTGLVIRR